MRKPPAMPPGYTAPSVEPQSATGRGEALDHLPRARLASSGPATLSDRELLAMVIGAGPRDSGALEVAVALLERFESLRRLADAPISELKRKPLGTVGATRLAACLELGRRAHQRAPEERPTVLGPQDVVDILCSEFEGAREERFVAAHLDTKHRVIRKRTVSVGTLDSTVVHPREVFRDAITDGAAAVVVAHNHPSGDPEPSRDDEAVTRRLAEAGRTIGIALLDHVVVGAGGKWVSLKSRNVF